MSIQEDLAYLVEEIQYQRDLLGSSKKSPTPADRQKRVQEINRLTAQIESKSRELNTEMIAQFRLEYANSGGFGAVGRQWTDRAYRNRKRTIESMTRASSDIRQWAVKYEKLSRATSDQKALKEALRVAKAAGKEEDVKKIEETLTNVSKFMKDNAVPEEPSVRYSRGRGSARKNMTYPADQYFQMLAKTSQALNRNYAILAAAAKASGYVIVTDGSGCGVTSHKDSEKAHGQVWEVNFAARYPIAHPNCQRQFIPSEGPPKGKKTTEQRRSLGLLKNQKLKSAAKGTAKALAAGGVVMAIGGEVVSNPFTQRFLREILSDQTIHLAPYIERYLTRLTSYAAREEEAFKFFGNSVGATTQEEFNTIIARSFDEDLANEAFLLKSESETVQITAAQARTLGVPFKLEKRQLMAALDDYGDWTIHRNAINKNLEEILADELYFGNANDELHGVAAIKFHISTPPGASFQKNWYKIVKDLQLTYGKNPEQANRDLVRLFASVVDPSPWMKVDLPANFKISLGMTSKGRQDLAEKLYLRLIDGTRLTETELRWARELGMDVQQLIKARPEDFDYDWHLEDIKKAFTPRITFQPGKLMSATVGLVDGKIIPILRVYPDGALTRYVSLSARLRSGAVEEFIKVLREFDGTNLEKIREAVLALDKEDLITSVRLFRNSPLSVSLRMLGLTPESFSVNALPGNDFLRYSYRFMFEKPHIRALREYIEAELATGKPIDAVLNSLAIDSAIADEITSAANMYKINRPELSEKQILERMIRLKKFENDKPQSVLKYLLNEVRAGQTIEESLLGAGIKGKKGEAVMREVRRMIRLGLTEQEALVELGLDSAPNMATMFEDWKNGISILPRLAGGFTLNGFSISQREALLRLKMLGNSLMVISKKTRYGYDELLAWWANERQFFKELTDSFVDAGGFWKQKEQTLSEYIHQKMLARNNPNWVDTFYDPRYDSPLDFVDPELLGGRNPSLENDLKKFEQVWTNLFPDFPVPRVAVSNSITNPLETKGGVIFIRSDVADEWDLLAKMRVRGVKNGWFPPGTEDMVATLFHEGAHAMMQDPRWTKRALNDLMKTLYDQWNWSAKIEIDSTTDLQDIRKWLGRKSTQEQIAKRIGGYAASSRDPEEIIAEMLSEFVTSRQGYRTNASVIYDKFVAQHGYGSRVAPMSVEEATEIHEAAVEKIGTWIGKRLDALQNIVDSGGSVPNSEDYSPQWWWLDDPAYEDVDIDKALTTHPELVDDIKAVYDQWKIEFPNTQFPRFSSYPLDLDAENAGMHSSMMFYNTSTNTIYIPEATLANYKEYRKISQVDGIMGHFFRQSSSMRDTIRHEMGHYLDRNFTFQQRIDLLRAFQEGAPSKRMQKIGKYVADKWERNPTKYEQMTTEELMTEWYQTITPLMNKEAKQSISEDLSGYASSDWAELLAEAFASSNYAKSPADGKLAWEIRKLLDKWRREGLL